ncbi:putative TOS1-like glycosyl hydrolase-domain-containing protein [Lasiosphaeria hispida]|uniref:glucan endo-1,3-beta-D-glucosidase n=1 Tax=Lasiosphaeria hispida TaxID=260671 RepID=A0AAJ0HT50_9PEZI|nr:putative TOS1-like glycosyl hydrolase-domain-containing protein [Lasiosphaeria hispida]KAK3362203.1 putative TOS1-like glycosyl hydrolase-domain-containing protein [Lasiosphaeria hispida]
MKIDNVGLALLASAASATGAAVASRAVASQQLCQGKSFEENGNFYCKAVQHIVYNDVGAAGEYKQVTYMDQSTGDCRFESKQFSGPLAPFNEPMSLHFRGPLQLKQMAVYIPGGQEPGKRDGGAEEIKSEHHGHARSHHHLHQRQNPHHHHHQHQQFHQKKHDAGKEVEKRKCPEEWVTAVIDGKTVSWLNDWCPGYTPTVAPTAAPSASAPPKSVAATTTAPASNAAAPSGSSFGKAGPKGPIGGAFVRTGYYDAASQKAEGLTFLGNLGGQGSGKWTPKFGNTLSYINSQAMEGAAKPEVLADTTIPSSHEVIVMTDKKCDSESCGYVQDGAVAYQGFAGADKTFLLEFTMPHDHSGSGPEADMPAIWMLNARIPYTSQYSACSCWTTGCGEFDVFETLSPGSTKAKSTFHGPPGVLGGDSNYFDRPVGGAIRVAVVYDSASLSVSVKVLDGSEGMGDGTFPAAISAEDIQALLSDSAVPAGRSSSFRMAHP